MPAPAGLGTVPDDRTYLQNWSEHLRYCIHVGLLHSHRRGDDAKDERDFDPAVLNKAPVGCARNHMGKL